MDSSGLGYRFQWMGQPGVGFRGLACEFRLMVESSMAESFKACTTIEVRHLSASIFCFLLFFSCF